MKRLLALVLLLAAVGAPAFAEAQADLVRAAKELVFDKKYAEARAAWQQILAGASGSEAETAAYWVARCSESLGENERALREYGQFLDRKPADRAYAEEARTSRVGLATKLVRSGQRQYLSVLTAALSDSDKTVRYYTALQLASLGKDMGMAALPTLKEIVAKEKDEDLVERAKIAILRLDPSALAKVPAPPPPAPLASTPPVPKPAPAARPATWIRVRVYQHGSKDPEVSINLPLSLAELVYKSLPDDARKDLKLKGYDADNFWERLKKLGPTEILSIDGKDGERVQIWLE
jgi:tetratricopeptide (TPR) repeat protein